MIDVNWDLAPEGATELVRVALAGQKWRNSETRQYWNMNKDFAGYYNPSSPLDESEVLATRPTQTKTVADAVEYYKGIWPSSNDDCIWYSKSHGFEYGFVECDAEEVCTREQLEAYVKEQESEKWTHTWEGDKCRVVFTEDTNSWIKGHFINTIVHTESLKPIKPKISESEMMQRITQRALSVDDDDEFGAKVRAWLDGYDII